VYPLDHQIVDDVMVPHSQFSYYYSHHQQVNHQVD
jgi:hypothetical protein